jgi:hypothetical protein
VDSVAKAQIAPSGTMKKRNVGFNIFALLGSALLQCLLV